MAENTAIEWTDASLNPIRARLIEIQNDGSRKERIGWHCVHVSEGCRYCYAETFNRRLGTGRDYAPDELYRAERESYRNGAVKLFLDEKILSAPLRWRKPRRIFVSSMTDIFADFVPDEWLDRIFAVMALAPQHTFQVLTKRAERMRDYLTAPDLLDRIECRCMRDWDATAGNLSFHFENWPLPQIWLGVSVEDQKHADERIPLLLVTPAAKRFISAEPLLGAVDLRRLRRSSTTADGVYRIIDSLTGRHGHIGPRGYTEAYHLPPTSKLDWVIGGGESGHDARPMHPDWPRSLRDQCQAAGVPFFFKQWGEFGPVIDPADGSVRSEGAGSIGAFWDRGELYYLNRGEGHCDVYRVGKKAAGRLLDGRTWDEVPA